MEENKVVFTELETGTIFRSKDVVYIKTDEFLTPGEYWEMKGQ